VHTTKRFHYVDWRKALGLAFVHVVGIIGVVYFAFNFSWPIFWAAVGYFFACHLAITVGAHRYFTHQAFKAQPWFAKMLAVCFSATQQGPLYWWVVKHLQHHGNEDKPGKDPHTPQDGFWHAHMLWIISAEAKQLPQQYTTALDQPGVHTDVIYWQRRHHWWLFIVMGYIVPGGIGFLLGDAVAGILVIGFTRLILQYHLTWVVNSIGHTFGQRLDGTATNFGGFAAPLIGVLTVGESYHANHHISPSHWRLGRQWWQCDPGMWFLWFARWCGWVFDFREPPNRRRRQPA
jgi:stearoyl-CoA desaturase (delta-9 desaturase)